ncbi:hypothetical protein N177_0421 [Lutibaculum baratangense AMV1]|uniref:TadE-like domain-containing protein n=2 Tax=Lutibaculum TaxID=1358438 RepID=V4RVC7_9HYPH|nr:hypothetical protein N177_0421 [Lutibaculum baratangense AMV1]
MMKNGIWRRRLLRLLKRGRRCDRGMAAVEFAVIAPLLSITLLGVVDVAWLALQRSDMHSAVRTGGQYFMAGGLDLSEAEAIIRGSWTQAPENATVTITQFCRCGPVDCPCNVACPDGSVPDAFTKVVISAPLETIFQKEEIVYVDTIRIR